MATATEALLAYGYTEVSPGLFVPLRPSSEKWEKVDGGFLRYDQVTAPIGGGDPWGQVLDGGLMKVPYRQAKDFENASGLHPARNPGAFEWVWPEARVLEIYQYASTGASNPYVRQDDGSIV